MERFYGRHPRLAVCFCVFLLALFSATQVDAQGLGLPSYGLSANPLQPPSVDTRGLAPADSVYLSDGMFRDLLPPIPNLEVGYLWNLGKNVRTGRLTLDYTLPVGLGFNAVVFAEAHGEFTDFWKTVRRVFSSGNSGTDLSSINERTDLSFGGGYRKLINDRLLVGVNGFYDSSRLAGKWYGSGGLGIETAWLISGNDALDLNFNYYGNLFMGRNSIVNAFRNGSGNFDVEAGYSHQLFDGGPDLRLKVTGYQFDIGTKVYGWNTGAELKTRNGVFSLRLDAGRDRINETYYTIGGFVNVGLQLGNLLSGQSPFNAPEPIFKSPRNLKYLLATKVKRNWHQPVAVMLARSQQAVSSSSNLPTFRMTITGNVIGTSTFDADSGVWSLDVFGAQVNAGCIALFGPGGAVRAAQYTVSLVGDTSRLTFPLTFTLTPIPDTSPSHGAVGILVNDFPGGGCVAGSLNAPLTAPAATLLTPTSTFVSSAFVFQRPIVFVKDPLPPPGGNIGTFVITADSPNDALVAPLLVRIVRGP